MPKQSSKANKNMALWISFFLGYILAFLTSWQSQFPQDEVFVLEISEQFFSNQSFMTESAQKKFLALKFEIFCFWIDLFPWEHWRYACKGLHSAYLETTDDHVTCPAIQHAGHEGEAEFQCPQRCEGCCVWWVSFSVVASYEKMWVCVTISVRPFRLGSQAWQKH